MRLAGKVALVTGAGSGIGRAIALAFAHEGARVAVNDIREDAAEKVAGEINTVGGQALSVPADVADGRQTLKMFTRFLTVWNSLDILVNNAAVWFVEPAVAEAMEQTPQSTVYGGRATLPLDATLTMEDATWRRTIAVLVDGAFHCTREALKVMQTMRAGKIINITAAAGLTGLAGAPDYSAAAGGMIGFTKSLAKEVAGLGIQVNAIAPGFVDTPLLEALTPATKEALAKSAPGGRLCTAEEIAQLALFLATGEADTLVGQVVCPGSPV
jgi:NAD(P)-dependent dehydrogenase (short-subunit alcohol dehydrogenase family)